MIFGRLSERAGRLAAGFGLAFALAISPMTVRALDRAEAVDAEATAVRVGPDDLVRLSRFALCRSRSGALVLESPLAKVRVVLVERDAATPWYFSS